jgi:hypothetical protein
MGHQHSVDEGKGPLLWGAPADKLKLWQRTNKGWSCSSEVVNQFNHLLPCNASGFQRPVVEIWGYKLLNKESVPLSYLEHRYV